MRQILICSLAAGLFAAGICNAGPADIWRSLGQLEASAAGLPAELQPAVEFQKVYLKMVSGLPREAWLSDLQKFSKEEGSVGDAARAWLARVEMEEIDAALREYYAENVAFPDSLEQANLPPALHVDPWGEKWAYHTRSPSGFAGMAAQRYELGPSRFPKLTSFKEAIRTPQKERGWKVSLRDIAGSQAVEFRRAGAATPFATLEKGGKVEDCTLLFIGGNWVLMAGPDQLFALTF